MPRIDRTSAAGLAVALVIGAAWVLPSLRLNASPDAALFYLPLARRLLAEGLSFFRAPEAMMYAPLAYVWPALFGGIEPVVRVANVVLFLLTVALAWHAASVAHSRNAGIAAALLVAISPQLRLYSADALTEPLFIFLIGAWAAATAHLTRPDEGHPRAWLAVGAAALALAPLSRPAVALFAPIAALACAAWAWRGHAESRPVARRLACLHALSLLGPLAWMLHNYLAHGAFSIANGLGGALWLGTDPLVDGFDPIYFGLDFDTGAIARDMPHLSSPAERILRGAALLSVHDIPVSTLAGMALRKLVAFVTVTGMEPTISVAPHRAWRLAVLALALVAFAWARRGVLMLALVLYAAYMTSVHLPLLYNHRYSIGSLDLPLAILAGIGVAEATRDRRRLVAACVTVTLFVAAGLLALQVAPGSPHVERSQGQVLMSAGIAAQEGFATRNATSGQPGEYQLAPHGSIDIPVRYDPRFVGDHTATILGLSIAPGARTTGCGWLRLRYRPADEPGFTSRRDVRVPVRADGEMHPLVVGTTIPLHMTPAGVLRVEFECQGPATLRTGEVTVVSPRRAHVYHDRYMERQGR